MEVPPFSSSVGERKIMSHLVVYVALPSVSHFGKESAALNSEGAQKKPGLLAEPGLFID
jgi:hypothetical protein